MMIINCPLCGHKVKIERFIYGKCLKEMAQILCTVLDPFMGSGTTLIAAYLNKRKSIGVEIDKEYCDLAIKRLKQEAQINQSNFNF